MQHSEWHWQDPTGLDLYAQSWQPDGPASAVVVLIHGLGEHSGRYTHVAHDFAQAGLAILAPDLWGHGKSGGKRGAAGFDEIFPLMQHMLQEARTRFPNLPVFLYGHSMGGALTLEFLLRQKPDIRGAIVTSPGLGVGSPVSPSKLLLARILGSVMPTATLANGLSLANLSHDQAVIQAYQDDPLVHDRISARLGLDLITRGKWVTDHADELAVPLLLAQGDADTIVSVEATRRFAQAAPRSLITFQVWDGLYHETHNEPQNAKVIACYRDWILSHL